jgi:predicted dehydrogenase
LIQQDYPNVISYATLEDVLESDADLIIVNTRWELILNMKVLLAGKHAVVEKAFTTTVAKGIGSFSG